MIRVSYTATFKATIEFEDGMTYTGMTDTYCPLQAFIDKARELMIRHDFDTADIVDTETGEVLAQLVYEDDDGEPEYYDDGETCGYE